MGTRTEKQVLSANFLQKAFPLRRTMLIVCVLRKEEMSTRVPLMANGFIGWWEWSHLVRREGLNGGPEVVCDLYTIGCPMQPA